MLATQEWGPGFYSQHPDKKLCVMVHTWNAIAREVASGLNHQGPGPRERPSLKKTKLMVSEVLDTQVIPMWNQGKHLSMIFVLYTHTIKINNSIY